jgi:uroporphyrinogen decarboxylase
MDHRQRILAAIRHQPVDRVPTDMWATREVQEKLFDHFDIGRAQGPAGNGASLLGGELSRGADAILELFERLDIDGIMGIAPPYVGPPTRDDGDYHENEWGMGYRMQAYGTGAYDEQVRYPLAEAETIADLEAYRWPDPDWYDYSALPGLARRFAGRAIECGYTAVFYYHNLLRGLELSLMDPILRPDFTRHLVWHISDFFTEYHRRCFEAAGGLVDMTQVTDDFGSQFGLMISPRVFETYYRAPMQRAIDLAKSYGLIIFHHDDGDMRKLLPALVEMGIEVLNPIQWRCGNWDLAELKAEYGGRLCFHSAVDNQQTLPHGTPGDVRAEVKWLIGTLASDRTGFILGPCHNLQPVTPVENIIAMYQAAREYEIRDLTGF